MKNNLSCAGQRLFVFDVFIADRSKTLSVAFNNHLFLISDDGKIKNIILKDRYVLQKFFST